MVNVSDVGSPVLWIHGFPLAAGMYEKQLAIDGVRHLTFDLPGFGQSPAAEISTVDDYARLALEVLDAAGIDRAIVAGFSMGGYIALALARLAPERLRGLILIDTRETADTEEARKGRYATIEKVKAEGTASVVDSMLPKMLTPGAPETMRDRVREMMSSASADGVAGALRAMAERPDSSELLPRIDVPTLIVVGEEDPITPPADAERMARAIPNATLVRLARAAHLSNYERAEEFNEAVREYVSAVSSPSNDGV
jgi:3-oxoadipate enol-lactonase